MDGECRRGLFESDAKTAALLTVKRERSKNPARVAWNVGSVMGRTRDWADGALQLLRLESAR